MTNKLSCPVPTHINPISPNGFSFSIQKLPLVTFFCQEVTIPTMNIGVSDFNNPYVKIPVPGEIIDFDQLTIQFLIDENMENYKSVHNWIIGLGFPEDNEQYRNYINQDTINRSELARGYSDGTLNILGSNNISVQSILFIDMFPTSIQSISFQSTNSDVNYLVGNVSFAYNYYKFL